MNVKPSLYVSMKIDEFRQRACRDLSPAQVLSGILSVLATESDVSIDDLLNMGDGLLKQKILEHLWVEDVGEPRP